MKARDDLPAGEVTLVFTDIEGSTRLLHLLGDRYAGALSEHRRLLREAFVAHSGVEVDTWGDALFTVSAMPRAPCSRRRTHNDRLRFTTGLTGTSCGFGMGVHTGAPARTDEGYVGASVHQAARIAAAAHGGQIVVSAAAAARAANELCDLVLEELGEHRLKDLSDPQELFQLRGAGLRESFPPLATLTGYFTNLPSQASALLGREAELGRVGALLGAHRLVTLTGTRREPARRGLRCRLARTPSIAIRAASSSATSQP